MYNTNRDAAEDYCRELKRRVSFDNATIGSSISSSGEEESKLKIRLVGGDLSLESTRDKIFQCFDDEFAAKGKRNIADDGDGADCSSAELALLVHNAGQYVGVTSANSDGLNKPEQTKKFGDGSLLISKSGNSAPYGIDDDNDKVDMSYVNYYHKLYGEAFIDLCERSLKRMREAHNINKNKRKSSYHGSIIGISSPGCNAAFSMTPGYDMPGSGKCLMEFSMRHYAINAAKFGITANVIIPGVTRSDAWDKVAQQNQGLKSGEELFDRMKGMIPLGEVAEGKDIGDVVAFLSGRGGGRFMTGLSLRVDGGLHLGRMQ